MENIDSYYAENTIPDEQTFASFDMSNIDGIQLNDVRTIFTHNSYKTDIPSLSYSLVNLVSTDLAQEVNYSHDRLTEQLQNGVRGFELDLQYSNGEFSIEHIPVFDNLTSCYNFELAMQEIAEWSSRNSKHVPITIMFEIKDLVPILSAGKETIDDEGWDILETILINVFGEENIITPADMMGDCSTLQEVALTDSSPALSDCLGKVMFLLHPSDTDTANYIARDTTMQSQVMIPLIYMNNDGSVDAQYEDYSLFRMYNNINAEMVGVFLDLTSQGYYIRTRMDADMEIDATRAEQALASCAQYLSTDFENGNLLSYTDYVASYDDGYYITLRYNI
ncbi:MAG: Ca2+-dependent phosphoinositide-specific phospholipase C [Bacillota bacterium]